MPQTIYMVTPSLNAAETIDDTIWSILSQRGAGNIRYHIQDGGSTDGTIEKLQTWEKRCPALSELLKTKIEFTFDVAPDIGLYDAISTAFNALDIPREAFMGWLGADDILLPGCFQTIWELRQNIPEIRWLKGFATIVSENGTIIHIKDRHHPQRLIAAGLCDLKHWWAIQQESCFWEKSLFDEAGGLDATFHLAGDWDLWRRFAAFTPVVHIARQMGAFRIRDGQKSRIGSSDRNMYSNYWAEIDRCIPHSVRDATLRSLLVEPEAIVHYPCAVYGKHGKWYLSLQQANLNHIGNTTYQFYYRDNMELSF